MKAEEGMRVSCPNPTQKYLLLNLQRCGGWEVQGREQRWAGAGGFVLLCLIFWIYKIGLNSPNLQT